MMPRGMPEIEENHVRFDPQSSIVNPQSSIVNGMPSCDGFPWQIK